MILELNWPTMLTMTSQPVASTPAVRPAAVNRQTVVIRAHKRDSATAVDKAATALLAAGVAVGLTLGAPTSAAFAKPTSLEQRRQEQEQALQSQLSKLEYAIQQQETAARAQIVGKRQQLENTVEQVDTAIQRKLIEEAANEQAAAKKGDEQRALRIEEEATRIKEQEAAIQVAAAKASAEIDREQMVERAREVEKQQEISKATNSFMELLGLTEADLGISK